MRTNISSPVRPSQLAKELSSALRRSVAVSVQQPDDHGNAGVILVVDAASGQPIPDAIDTLTTVREVVADHRPQAPERKPDPKAQLVAALEEADTLDAVKAALITYHSAR